MCEGVVTESFYSKVERDKSRIDTVDLIKILNNHKVSLYDFFAPFDKEYFNQEKIKCRAISAFNSHNLEELKSIQKKVANQDGIRLHVKLMIALLQNKVEQLPKKLRQEMQYNILQIGSWNKKSLWELSIVMGLYEFDELTILIESIFEEYKEININDTKTLIPLANIFINYLVRCYEQHDIEKCRKVIRYVANLPSKPEIVLNKLLGRYYQAKIDGDCAKANIIHNLLAKSGYKDYL